MPVTKASQWRSAREEGIEFTFPSGNVAAIRPIEIDFFVKMGHVPSSLAGVVADVIDGKSFDPKIIPSQLIENKKEWVTFLDELTTFAFVNPKVVENPQSENEISLDDVGYADKLYMWVLFTRPAYLLRAFREKQSEHVAVVDTPADNGRTSQQDHADQSVGESSDGNARHLDSIAVR